MATGGKRCLLLLAVFMLSGCEGSSSGAKPVVQQNQVPKGVNEQDENAEVQILFIGNSHTHFHNIPGLVRRMMMTLKPESTVAAKSYEVIFLEDAARDSICQKMLGSRRWSFVVLQAQKISSSGRYHYSTEEGIDVAKKAKQNGATVYFFSEWGRKGVADEGERTQKIYEEMAQTAGADVAPIGRAWDIALAERPDMVLHAFDGNHESEVGAFLTACVLSGQLTGEDPTPLTKFDYPAVSSKDREFLADAAARALKEKKSPSDDSKSK